MTSYLKSEYPCGPGTTPLYPWLYCDHCKGKTEHAMQGHIVGTTRQQMRCSQCRRVQEQENVNAQNPGAPAPSESASTADTDPAPPPTPAPERPEGVKARALFNAELAALRASYTDLLAERDAMQSMATQAGRELADERAKREAAERRAESAEADWRACLDMLKARRAALADLREKAGALVEAVTAIPTTSVRVVTADQPAVAVFKAALLRTYAARDALRAALRPAETAAPAPEAPPTREKP